MPKYNSIENIPAKVFFEIVKTKDYQLLRPKPREKNLDKVFMQIYDDYFIRSDNEQAKEFLRLQNEMMINAYKIDILKNALAFYYFTQTTKEMRDKFIEALKIGYGIVIDETVPFREEVKRILDIEIGILQNEISLAKIQMDRMRGDSQVKEIDFYDRMIGLSNILVGNTLINADMTLAVLVALEKSIREKQEREMAR